MSHSHTAACLQYQPKVRTHCVLYLPQVKINSSVIILYNASHTLQWHTQKTMVESQRRTFIHVLFALVFPVRVSVIIQVCDRLGSWTSRAFSCLTHTVTQRNTFYYCLRQHILFHTIPLPMHVMQKTIKYVLACIWWKAFNLNTIKAVKLDRLKQVWSQCLTCFMKMI